MKKKLKKKHLRGYTPIVYQYNIKSVYIVQMSSPSESEIKTTQTVVINQSSHITRMSKSDGEEVKERKQVVTKVFRRRENSGLRQRIITIKYEYNRETKTIKYAAAVWCVPLKTKERYNKKAHLETVESRFEKKPIVIYGFEDYGSSGTKFHDNIRKLMFTNGCCYSDKRIIGK